MTNTSPAPTSDSATQARGRVGRVAAVVIGLLAVVAAATLATWLVADDSGASEFVVEVAAGTATRIEAGEEIELIPARVELDVGDTLVIVNEDDQVHQVGPYVVGPEQTLRQTFATAGTVAGLCSLHPSGQVEIIIR